MSRKAGDSGYAREKGTTPPPDRPRACIPQRGDITAQRARSPSGAVTTGAGVLESRETSPSRAIHYECGVSLYLGNTVYPARPDGERQIKIRAREANTDQLRAYTCKF
ncbi:MAG: hypothetical protein DMG31_02045 [Acidobacteria bacterium]|nr:MAG: hypothetical protein DMG31_02045 [Acidobacteriota bacterium]